MTALYEIAEERRRQVKSEGFDASHDDKWINGEMADAAASYAMSATRPGTRTNHWFPADLWPWDRSWWKPATKRIDLIKAGALILAELERLDRLDCPPMVTDEQMRTNAWNEMVRKLAVPITRLPSVDEATARDVAHEVMRRLVTSYHPGQIDEVLQVERDRIIKESEKHLNRQAQ